MLGCLPIQWTIHPREGSGHFFLQSVTGAVMLVKAPWGPTACSVWRAVFSTKELVWNSAPQLSTRSQIRARVSSWVLPLNHFYQWVALLSPAGALGRCDHMSDRSLLSTTCIPWSCAVWGLNSIVWETVRRGTEFTLCMCFSGCDQHCLECHQPNECSLCEAPFFLLDTQCVYKCGKGYYTDHAQQKCMGKRSECDVAERNQGCRLCSVHCAMLKWRGSTLMLS